MINAEAFSEPWVRKLQDAWNDAPANRRKLLADAGFVRFEVNDEGGAVVEMLFDNLGRISTVSGRTDLQIPTFSGSLCSWEAFITGKVPAVKSVLTRALRYEGTITFAMRFGASFDHLAEYARAADATSLDPSG